MQTVLRRQDGHLAGAVRLARLRGVQRVFCRRSGPVQALLRRPDIQLASKVQMERMRRVHRVYVAGDGSEDLI